MERKTKMICVAVCAVVLIAILVMVIVMAGRKDPVEAISDTETVETTEPEATEENTETDTMEEGNTENTDDTTETQKETNPPIKDDPVLPSETEEPDIDVSQMTRHPEPEVVDGKIEYETKE